MDTFKFTLQTPNGIKYTFTGSVENLYRHLKANQGVSVLEDKTEFNTES